MQQQLAGIVESLEHAQNRLRRLSDSIKEDAFVRRPGPNRWSAGDCVEHLNLTSRAYLPLFRDAIAEARQLGPKTETHYKKDALGWFMTMMIGPMHRVGKFRLMKVKTTPAFVPRGGQSRSQLLSEFVRLEAEVITLIRAGDGLPLDRVKVVSPFGGRMKYNAYAGMVIVARHQHRHLDQAEEAVRSTAP